MNKRIYWGATGLLSAMVLMSVGMYIFNHGMVSDVVTSLGYPTYIIYPLAAAKFLAVVAILSKKSALLKEWAYAGLFFTFLLGFSAHLMIRDGGHMGALVALVLLAVSYTYDKKVYGRA